MRLLIISALCILAASCQSSAPGPVSHVVICWLKSPGDEAARQRIIDATQELRKIPGVVTVTAGRPIPSTRPVVDSSYDVGIVITFKDEAALRAYETNPIHVKARNEVLRPLAGRIVIYDFDIAASAGVGAKKEADAAVASAPAIGSTDRMSASAAAGVTKP